MIPDRIAAKVLEPAHRNKIKQIIKEIIIEEDENTLNGNNMVTFIWN